MARQCLELLGDPGVDLSTVYPRPCWTWWTGRWKTFDTTLDRSEQHHHQSLEQRNYSLRPLSYY